MLEAIRVRALDPYAALHLDPLATPALVTAMYRMLAERARTAPETLARLNAARSMLIDTASRGAYDRAHGYGERRAARNHYELLGVAIDADAAAIDLAYSVGTRNGAAAPAPISSAHRTLSNPYLRARYDASLTSPTHPATEPLTPAHIPYAAIEPSADIATAFERRMMLTTPPTPLAPPAHQSNDQTADRDPAQDDASNATPGASHPACSTFSARKAMFAPLRVAEAAPVPPRRTAPHLDPAPAITAARDDRSDLRHPASETPAPAPQTPGLSQKQRRADRQPRELPRPVASDAMTARLLELAPSAIAPAQSTRTSAPPNASGTPPIRWALLTADD